MYTSLFRATLAKLLILAVYAVTKPKRSLHGQKNAILSFTDGQPMTTLHLSYRTYYFQLLPSSSLVKTYTTTERIDGKETHDQTLDANKEENRPNASPPSGASFDSFPAGSGHGLAWLS